MTKQALTDTVLLGTITGMRSMAGPAALAIRGHGAMRMLLPLLAAGEMVADKTAVVGDRIDPLPLAGRALMGALVGGTIARGERGSVIAGGLVGAMTAVVAAHIAFRVRTRLPVSTEAAGLLEDALVFGLAASAAR